jgi:hypothetical protein
MIIVGTWFAFKHALRRRALKLERTNLNYGALARMTRDGGFWVRSLSQPKLYTDRLDRAYYSALRNTLTLLHGRILDL